MTRGEFLWVRRELRQCAVAKRVLAVAAALVACAAFAGGETDLPTLLVLNFAEIVILGIYTSVDVAELKIWMVIEAMVQAKEERR